MTLFLAGIATLVLGYFTYGWLLERVVKPDGRETPATASRDGVDYLPLPLWKNLLIQLLNIAGIGPVIGVIIGIKFGTICFWIIPLGCIVGGAVHDFVSGFMSLRTNGANLPVMTRNAFGGWYSRGYTLFVALLLLLVVAVFINVPARLSAGMAGNGASAGLFWAAVGTIFAYYAAATLFPVDKLIGRIYPLFGGLLLLGSLAMLGALLREAWADPALLTESEGFRAGMFADQPIVPCLFVTIACGIISGFHATQSPIVARTLGSERHARAVYYGMMIAEGVIAMIWAGAALAIYNLLPELTNRPATEVLCRATERFLGSFAGRLTIVSVIVLAVTSGDTALRSLRLTCAEVLRLPQSTFRARLLLCLPLVALVGAILWWSNGDAESFEWLWKYFAWGNQVISASTLMACTVWMMRQGRPPWFTLLPGSFMTFVVASFILWSHPSHPGCPYGFNLPLAWAYALAGLFTAACAAAVLWAGRRRAA